MFKITNSVENMSEFYIFDAVNYCYLHSDGSEFSTREYFPTKRIAQKVLNKFYPEPEHVWEHGDVFLRRGDTAMICIMSGRGELHIFCVDNDYCLGVSPYSGHKPEIEDIFADPKTKFLFNIKEKLCQHRL